MSLIFLPHTQEAIFRGSTTVLFELKSIAEHRTAMDLWVQMVSAGTHLDMLVGASLGRHRGAVLQRPADEDLGRALAQTAGNVGHQRSTQQRWHLLTVQHVRGRGP